MTAPQQQPITVLVTGVGAIIGQGIIRSLRKACYPVRIVGIDRSDQSPGPRFCDAFFQKPTCAETDVEYLEYWRNLLTQEQISLILPGLEVDVFFFNQQREFFAQLGVAVALNTPELIALSSDKWNLGNALQQQGLPCIPSAIPQTWQEAVEALGPPPLLLKPRQGNGSRGIVRLYDETDFLYWRAKTTDEWIMQRIVGTDQEEYTVGVFGFGDGTALAPIVFRRRLSGAGNTLTAKVVQDAVIEQAAGVLTKRFRPRGPTNYQFRKEDDRAWLLEINPRFSSSNSLRSAFGYNEAEMSIEYFVQGRIPKERPIRPGIAWRYSEDFVSYDCDFV